MRTKLLNRKPAPVTLIVGIVCENGIVVASDSQTTQASLKSLYTAKVNDLGGQFGQALVGGAGATLTIGHAIEQLSAIAASGPDAPLPELASQAIKRTRDLLRYQQFNCSSAEFQTFLEREELGCELMLAHWDGTERLDTIKLAFGVPERSRKPYCAIGSGAGLANYFLEELWEPQLDGKVAAVIAVHVVESVKRHDLYCGGPTQLGILTLPEAALGGPMRSFVLPANETREIVEIVLQADRQTRAERARIIRDALGNGSSEQLMKFFAEQEKIEGHSQIWKNKS